MIDDSNAHAYRVMDNLWAEPAGKVITWSVANQPISSNGWSPFGSYLTAGDATQVQRAFATWAAVANVSFVQVSDSTDVNIRLGRETLPLSSGVVGDSTPYYDPRHHIIHAQVEFNSSYLDQRSFTSDNVYALAVHEIGHALGLDHSSDANAIMYYANTFQSASLRTKLAADDIAGIQAIYGAPGSSISPITADVATKGAAAANEALVGSIAHPAETPWYRIVLERGKVYDFDEKGVDSGDGTLTDPYLILRDSNGAQLASDDETGAGHNARIAAYRAGYSGTYYLDAEGFSVHDTGSFTLAVTSAGAPTPTPTPPPAVANNATDNATLFGAPGAALITTGNNQMLVAGAGAETLSGSGFNNTIFGGSGIDSLVGGGGDDIIVAGAGGGTIDGGGGINAIFAGAGFDRIAVSAPAIGTLTGIAGFQPGDKLAIHPGSFTPGQDAATQAALQLNANGHDFLWLGYDPAAGSDKWIILLGAAPIVASDIVIV